MTSKLVPSNPPEVMVIRKVTENITTFSAPFARFGYMKIGGRGTVVRLASGKLAVFSPTALTPEVKETVASMGNVGYLVAPDFEHHIYLGPWHQAYPSAKVIGPEGLPEKRAKQKNEEVKFDRVFTPQNSSETIDEEFDREFDYEYIGCHANKELVFNYRRDRTLIQADLIFNLPATEQYSKSKEDPNSGILTKFFTAINNTSGSATNQKRFIWYIASSQNRPDFNARVARIEKWDFDRMIPCHGDVIETGAKGVFQKVLQWHLQGAQKQ